MAWIYHRNVSPIAPSLRQCLAPLALAGPVVLALASPESLRPVAIAAGVALLAAGAPLSGLIERDDVAQLAAGLRLGAPRRAAPADGDGDAA